MESVQVIRKFTYAAERCSRHFTSGWVEESSYFKLLAELLLVTLRNKRHQHAQQITIIASTFRPVCRLQNIVANYVIGPRKDGKKFLIDGHFTHYLGKGGP